MVHCRLALETGSGFLLVGKDQIDGEQEWVFEAAIAAHDVADQVAEIAEVHGRRKGLHREGADPRLTQPHAIPIVTDIDIFIEQLLGDQSLVVHRDRAAPRRRQGAWRPRLRNGARALA